MLVAVVLAVFFNLARDFVLLALLYVLPRSRFPYKRIAVRVGKLVYVIRFAVVCKVRFVCIYARKRYRCRYLVADIADVCRSGLRGVFGLLCFDKCVNLARMFKAPLLNVVFLAYVGNTDFEAIEAVVGVVEVPTDCKVKLCARRF